MRKLAGLISLFSLTAACGAERVVEPASPEDVDAMREWNSSCYHSFWAHVEKLSEPSALDCGFFGVDSLSERKREVQDCAKAAVGRKDSVKFGHASYGDDSHFCQAAIFNKETGWWDVFYDSDVTGGSEQRSALWVSQCTGILFAPGTIGPDSFFAMQGCKRRDDVRKSLLSK